MTQTLSSLYSIKGMRRIMQKEELKSRERRRKKKVTSNGFKTSSSILNKLGLYLFGIIASKLF